MKKIRSIRLKLAISLLLLALGFGGLQACLPGPTTLQVEAVINCRDVSTPVTQGVFDVSVLDTYYMKMNIISMLVITADPGLFRPESNFVDLKEVKVWFEYPPNFSRQSLGSQLLKTQENPLVVPIATTLRPSLQGDFMGQMMGAAGGAAPTGQPVEFYLIPTELSRLWFDATELNAKALTNQQAKRQTGASFKVVAHITISGITRGGQSVTTPEYRFPIQICKGCLDGTKSETTPPALCGAGAGAGVGTLDCRGQDGVCLTNQEQGAP